MNLEDVKKMADQLTFEPIGDYCLVKPLNPNMTAGGIALPDGSRIDVPRGLVLKVGPGRDTEMGMFLSPIVEVGDVVAGTAMVKDRFATMEWEEGGETYLIVRSRDLMGKVKEPIAPKIVTE